MYAVIHADSREEISRHATVPEALAVISTYEAIDAAAGEFNEYDWTPVEDDSEER